MERGAVWTAPTPPRVTFERTRVLPAGRPPLSPVCRVLPGRGARVTDPRDSASSLSRLQHDPGRVSSGRPVVGLATDSGRRARRLFLHRAGAIPAPGPPRPPGAPHTWPVLCGGLATSTSSTAPFQTICGPFPPTTAAGHCPLKWNSDGQRPLPVRLGSPPPDGHRLASAASKRDLPWRP